MLLINLARAVILALGMGVILAFKSLAVGWFLLVFAVVMAVVFTLGDLTELKLLQLFSGEDRINP